MDCSRARIALRVFLFVVSLACFVQWLKPQHIVLANESASPSAVGCSINASSTGPLPPPVAEMRDAILAAVRSGNIEDLRTALEWNELKPHIADEPVDDPIAYWKRTSGDGEGREILAILAEIFDCGHTVLPIGKDIENNDVFVWPALAEADLANLTPQQEVALYRLITPAELKTMRENKRWQWWRLAIGADGTWHTFHKAK